MRTRGCQLALSKRPVETRSQRRAFDQTSPARASGQHHLNRAGLRRIPIEGRGSTVSSSSTGTPASSRCRTISAIPSELILSTGSAACRSSVVRCPYVRTCATRTSRVPLSNTVRPAPASMSCTAARTRRLRSSDTFAAVIADNPVVGRSGPTPVRARGGAAPPPV